jgi:FtsH-binding integral membrane protein
MLTMMRRVAGVLAADLSCAAAWAIATSSIAASEYIRLSVGIVRLFCLGLAIVSSAALQPNQEQGPDRNASI